MTQGYCFHYARVMVLLLLGLIRPACGFIMIWPWFQCSLAALFYDLDLEDFTRYDEYFRDDSTVMLAQAGVYQGAADILEYIKFAVPGESPYLASGLEDFPIEASFLDYDWQTNECIFLATSLIESTTVEETTVGAITRRYMSGFKLYFNYYEQYITELRVFYPVGYLDYQFGTVLNSDNTRRYVCSVYEGVCKDRIEQVDDCEARLAALPPTEGPTGSITGNSTGCRALHAAFAETNPSGHCPHISFSPQADDSGQFKCQTLSTMTPDQLFTEDEIARFREYAEENGIDFDVGYVIL